jgi:hypothetical protein
MITLNNFDIKLINKSSIKKIYQGIKISPYNIKTVDMPNIEECKSFISDFSNVVNLKSLKKCLYFRCSSPIIDLPKLEYAGEIDVTYSNTIYLPKLKTVKDDLWFNSAKEIYLYTLDEAQRISCGKAKLLVIPKKFALEKLNDKKTFKINSDCEIVYTENYIKKESFSFKSFFSRN